VYGRELDSQVLTLAPSGYTYNYLFVLYDYETESWWWPVKVGVGSVSTCGCDLWSVTGPHRNRLLPGFFVDTEPWDDWFLSNPNSLYMKDTD